MRFIILLLASMFAVGCGAGSPTRNAFPVVSALVSPSITTLVPNNVPVNSVPFTITINGDNFGTDATVFWNGTPLRTTFITSKQIAATLTVTDLTTVGLIQVFVRTGGLNSNTLDFNVTTQ
jgi:IPT/TIG domain